LREQYLDAALRHATVAYDHDALGRHVMLCSARDGIRSGDVSIIDRASVPCVRQQRQRMCAVLRSEKKEKDD
jgi:hypothetical protein